MLKFLQIIKSYWLSLTIIVFIAITFLSLWPLPQLPSVPGTDKTHHLIAYAVLAFPVAIRRPEKWLWIVLFFIVYSGFIELVQPYVNRYGEWLDMAANTAGVICGLLLSEIMNRMIPSLHNRKEKS